jgi:methyltransferase (TIGR00027 family)
LSKVSSANHTETDSVPGGAVGIAQLAFVEQTIWNAQRAQLRGDESLAATPPKPSALRVAILRAAHQLLDKPLVFEDPLALSILGADGAAFLRSDPSRCDIPRLKGFRASLALRGRIAEDQWAKEQECGARQHVILGAGLDTSAYRNLDRGHCRIFEVDLPAVIEWKRECLRAAGIQEPDSLTFVPTDFEHASLAEALRHAGFDAHTPAFFSCLGVTMYLEEKAVMHILRFVGSLAPGSGIVFDYAVHPGALSPQKRQAMERVDKRMAEAGEPWKTHLDPASFPTTLRTLGFADVHDFSARQLNARYLSGRTDGLRKGALTGIIRARV